MPPPHLYPLLPRSEPSTTDLPPPLPRSTFNDRLALHALDHTPITDDFKYPSCMVIESALLGVWAVLEGVPMWKLIGEVFERKM